MATTQDRWLGVPIVVTGMTGPARAVLEAQVARWQQARRQLCLSLLLGQSPDPEDPALLAILPDRTLRQEARRWALWLVSGDHGLLGWYRQTLQAMPAEPLWDREREFFAALKVQDHLSGPPDGSRLWRWHRRRGLDLTPWIGDGAGKLDVPRPARLQPWIEGGQQPLLGQWLYWDERWIIHLFWPGPVQEARTLPRVAAALLVPPLVSPGSTGYRVQRGDTLWGIAQTRTGSGTNWQRIYAANRQRIANPHVIFPGQVLTVPGTAQVGAAPATDGTIVVRPGDTLWRIASRQSGHGSWWPQLWQANRDRLRRPDRLAVGTVLRRPLSWSSGLQPASGTMAVQPPALQPPDGAQDAGNPPLQPQRAAAQEPVSPVLPARQTRKAVRTPPTVGRQPPVASQSEAQAPGAMRPPASSARPSVKPIEGGEPLPLIPTVPESPSSPAAVPLLTIEGAGNARAAGLDAQGQPVTPLNHPVAAPAGSDTTATPPTVRWHEPLQPLPERQSPAEAASDAAAQPASGTAGEMDGPVAAAPEEDRTESPIETRQSVEATVAAGSDQVAGARPPSPAATAPPPALQEAPIVEEATPPEPALPVPPPADQRATIRPAQGGADPWDGWMRPETPDPAQPQRLATLRLPQVAPAALWPQVGWAGLPEYVLETASRQPGLSGWAMNRQRLSAEWQSGAWLLRGRWTVAQYGLSGGDVRADRQESWVDVDFGQRWQTLGQLRLGLLGRATWWSRRGGMGQDTSLRAADIQGFGLGPVGQAAVDLGGGHQLMVEAAVQPLLGVTFSGPVQAAGQLGQVEGMVGWQGHWGAFQPHVGYRARWLYDADGRFGAVAHGLSAGLAVGWPGAAE